MRPAAELLYQPGLAQPSVSPDEDRGGSDHVVFEGTTPPDGEHLVGHAELRNVWAPIFENSLSHVEVGESIVIGDRVVQRCLYSWGDGHVRAVDLYRVQSGKIAEKVSYVKG